MDDSICTQYQNTLLNEIRRDKDTEERIDHLKGVIEKQAKKLKHIEEKTNDIHWSGRNCLEKLLLSLNVVCIGVIYSNTDYDSFLLFYC